ncbi:MAG: aldolase/citrate lyase family protein, partial [Terracoccus sp.]
DGLRLPRAEDPASVRWVAETTGLRLQLLLETARGLSRAADLAAAHQQVVGLGLGEADLAADLLVGSSNGLDWARGAVVVASRAAGLASPVQSVWTDVADLDGLLVSCTAGLAGGFFGRSVVHPAQLSIVHDVYTPTSDAVNDARGIVATAARAEADGEVAVLDADGRFVDAAVVARARVVLDRVPTHITAEPGGHQ